MNPERVAEIIQYQFRDGGLLSDALTHPSRRKGNEKTSAYERLEFLGDRVLGLVMAEILLRAFPGESEGDLAKRHAALVRAETCAEIALQWELDQHLSAASSEFTDGKIQNLATLSDAAEALIGAIYLDSDFVTAQAVITRFWAPLLDAKLAPPVEAKSALQEWAQGKGLPLPSYAIEKRSGPDHSPQFTIRVRVDGYPSASGTGNSRRAAEKAAAEALLKKIAAQK
jgi:ribonuclease-3